MFAPHNAPELAILRRGFVVQAEPQIAQITQISKRTTQREPPANDRKYSFFDLRTFLRRQRHPTRSAA
ncbi:hypothetical protein S4A8_03488 [Salinisphaera sp. S4-8]